MKMLIKRSLLIAVWALVGCGTPSTEDDGVDDSPSAEECETFTDTDSCLEAGCSAFLHAWAAETNEKGECVADVSKPREYFCVNRETGIDSQIDTWYYRGEDDEREVYLFSSDHGPLEGWSYCGLGNCGCMMEM